MLHEQSINANINIQIIKKIKQNINRHKQIFLVKY